MTQHIEKIVFGALLVASASPAFAGATASVPAPAIGIGIGAVVLIGAGYRAVKARIK
jgi:hypothetical protein